MLCRTIYLSLDPYMRGRMNPGPSYARGVELGEVMVGGTVSRVVESRLAGYAAGDIVLTANGWQDYALSDGAGVRRLDPADAPVSTALGVLGMPGHTAYVGLLDHGRPRPGETVVVSAASGAVGAVVGQIARIEGCRVVGVAGAPEKCAYVTDELGFDACVSHRADDLPDALRAACPGGIDVYFENVGGKVFEAVLPLLNDFARIPVCGRIANYNLTGPPPGPDQVARLMGLTLVRRLTFRGFIVFDSSGPAAGLPAGCLGVDPRGGDPVPGGRGGRARPGRPRVSGPAAGRELRPSCWCASPTIRPGSHRRSSCEASPSPSRRENTP